MALELYREVALLRNVPNSALRAGDVAILVDIVPHLLAVKMALSWKFSTPSANPSPLSPCLAQQLHRYAPIRCQQSVRW